MPPAPALDRLLTVSARYFGLPPETVAMFMPHDGTDRPASAPRRQALEGHQLLAETSERTSHAARQ